MKIINSLVPADAHKDFLAKLKKIKVGGTLVLKEDMIPALEDTAGELLCTKIVGNLWTFSFYFLGILLGEAQILHDNDVIAITLEE
jgi:hypothetical protein